MKSDVVLRVAVATAAVALAATGCSSSGSTVVGAAGGVSSAGSASGSSSGATSSSTAGSTASTAGSASGPTSASDPASSSSSPTTTVTAPAITNKLTDTVTHSGFKLKIDTRTFPFKPDPSSLYQPADVKPWLDIHLEVTNVGEPDRAFSMEDLEVVDALNERFVPSIVASNDIPKERKLGLVNLKAGEVETGEVIFAVPKDAKGLRLVFTGLLGDMTPKPVIDLGL